MINLSLSFLSHFTHRKFCETFLYLIWSFGNGIHILDDISHNVIQRRIQQKEKIGLSHYNSFYDKILL